MYVPATSPPPPLFYFPKVLSPGGLACLVASSVKDGEQGKDDVRADSEAESFSSREVEEGVSWRNERDILVGGKLQEVKVDRALGGIEFLATGPLCRCTNVIVGTYLTYSSASSVELSYPPPKR